MAASAKKKKRIQVLIDSDLYDDANEVLSDIGISQSTLINVLLKKVVAEGRVPFDLSQSKRDRLSFELHKAVQDSDIPIIKDQKEVARYLLENGDDSYDE
ncbi:MAG: type II toxin-antitoxin system RelB/DinJ family antitoxin [Lentilactobacillus hilgardii]|jgi:DNA-damage-inducible protein J|uniref:Damage-inducible protein n=1 Tax=Lentilactobacillus hilgardii TaxID=1588 RepID=A0A6P1E497_LENHI|nr:type II toxin-antitoxin system RelB/DinJ family antitoxin [Lentilactobacillus hilgardii]RRG10319.1 MAG: damage-inducible protein [Lactobacillus sp.]EEI71754.1 addiction module antitoxin, RelB/DinJ family [Lentilactobacillus hilgardii ATCC 27305]MBZ2202413.1 damage-inducible protein [Lentilactobacillus hilgardii]MBZ2204541.1 damage-inducible protein [Lentilactobacillus hilgardii]MCT3393137.1 damage-inducible protein [Lentilactobacillus hilgardii]